MNGNQSVNRSRVNVIRVFAACQRPLAASQPVHRKSCAAAAAAMALGRRRRARPTDTVPGTVPGTVPTQPATLNPPRPPTRPTPAPKQHMPVSIETAAPRGCRVGRAIEAALGPGDAHRGRRVAWTFHRRTRILEPPSSRPASVAVLTIDPPHPPSRDGTGGMKPVHPSMRGLHGCSRCSPIPQQPNGQGKSQAK